ncbi:hypothetical protein Rcae01_00476 [Novipirellula caenicola]|uniref:Secreted protein n=1 Tax=Novipirellula caenicola TaxID=1536901 RepID=A0ABP9VIK4_9BACT
MASLGRFARLRLSLSVSFSARSLSSRFVKQPDCGPIVARWRNASRYRGSVTAAKKITRKFGFSRLHALRRRPSYSSFWVSGNPHAVAAVCTENRLPLSNAAIVAATSPRSWKLAVGRRWAQNNRQSLKMGTNGHAAVSRLALTPAEGRGVRKTECISWN